MLATTTATAVQLTRVKRPSCALIGESGPVFLVGSVEFFHRPIRRHFLRKKNRHRRQ